MNQRMRELAEQAYDMVEFNYAPPQKIFNKEKFAELIVKECIGCCDQAISDPVPESVDTWLNGGSQCIQEIKLHFGVSE